MKGHVSIHGNVQLAQQLSPDIFLHEDDDKDEEVRCCRADNGLAR